MRFRTVHPDFWTDKVLGKVSDTARLTYIGLWMLADDAGWLDWDVEQMSIQLFPWVDSRSRQKRMNEAVKTLIEAGRVSVEPCGHARIPKLAVYQKPGHPYYAIRDEHKKCAIAGNSKPLTGIGSNSVSEGEVSEGNRVNEVNLTRARAHEGEDGGPSLKSRVEANGWDPSKIGAKKS